MTDADRMIREMLERANGQDQQQRMLQAMLQAAVTNPREIRILQRSTIALRKEEEMVVIMIATGDGVRIDVPIRSEVARQLGLDLAGEEPDASD